MKLTAIILSALVLASLSGSAQSNTRPEEKRRIKSQDEKRVKRNSDSAKTDAAKKKPFNKKQNKTPEIGPGYCPICGMG